VTNKSNARGIVLMVLSMGAFALADALVKLSASFMSPAQVLFFLMGGGLFLFAIMAIVLGEKLIDRRAFAPILLLRYFSEVAGMVGMVLALTYVPLSTVGAITQAAPILVVVGAVLFLDEKVSWRRWTSIVFGFVGVLLIVQPGAEGFDLAVLWAVVAMVALAIRDLTTRLTPHDMASTSLATYTMIAAIPFSLGWVLYNGESLIPAETNWYIAIPMICLGSIGYMLLITSIRMAEVSVVTPFRFSRIIFLLILGMLIFGERPSVLMLSGVTLIIVSGIYLMWREQRLKQSAEKLKV
jgi:drug/metabolite transporter (DMT)-like permease